MKKAAKLVIMLGIALGVVFVMHIILLSVSEVIRFGGVFQRMACCKKRCNCVERLCVCSGIREFGCCFGTHVRFRGNYRNTYL